ncbi:MAG: hypothetical protein RJA36_2076 [Pseudomonadota bacterium]|jgi:AAHS family benzoate transporter-like MFS transporter
MAIADDSGLEARRMRTVTWVVALATIGLIFDGYDLVVYGAVVSTFLRDPSQIGTMTPAIAGMLGSYMLFGVMVGALLAGSVGDILGRRKVILASYAWFSVGMALTAMTHDTATFGWLRFFTGLGVGSLVATTAALVAEYAPKGKKNMINAITNGGIPLGSLLISAGLKLDSIFYVLACIGVFGVLLTLLVSMSRSAHEVRASQPARGSRLAARSRQRKTRVRSAAPSPGPSGRGMRQKPRRLAPGGVFSLLQGKPPLPRGIRPRRAGPTAPPCGRLPARCRRRPPP